jgi:parvulin-like peptidyl-prolyl isomerase
MTTLKKPKFQHRIALLLITVGLTLGLLSGLVVLAQEDQADADLVIARIGDEEITLGEFQARIRYERLRYYQAFAGLVGEYGVEALNVDDPNNQFAPTVYNVMGFMANDREFGAPVYELMILERLYRQEVAARGLEITECDEYEYWALALNYDQPVLDCQPPEGLLEARDEYINEFVEFAGISAAEVELSIIGRALFDKVVESLAEEIELPDVQTALTRHITVEDEETAEEVLARLQAGDDFQELLLEYTTDEGAAGDRGELGFISRGSMPAAFSDAAFAAEVGELVGPVEVGDGFHIIEVTDRQFGIRVRHILLTDEADAETAIELLARGADFGELAREYSEDMGSGRQGGDLGFIERGATVPEFEEAAFGAEVGEVVGPVQSQFGYHIIEVTEISDEPSLVEARHILVETEEEAQAVLDRLEAGEDFSELAAEVSIHPDTLGHRGDTRTVITRGRQSGYYSPGETFAAIDAVVFEAEEGELVGPVSTTRGYLVIEVLSFDTRPPSAQELRAARDEYVAEWQDQQLNSDRVEQTTVWRSHVPHDPLPSEWAEELTALDALFEDAHEAYVEFLDEGRLLNVLRGLELPQALRPVPVEDIEEIDIEPGE